ncbi:MAG: type II toxin-antitoxin system HicA family toxin [Lachnospiraceae bacterium]|jgi:predicted RNA binding protein YcfA (HicA-like mRNA interferase family)|nr:type II toxin-antitoxin system HicA family toxin [Lachnospiraceae bacterium]MBQ4219773.1 type II toxin-antitoxin system HicA family toxin [Butyrivibrio sp.]
MKISEMKKLLRKNGCHFVRELTNHEEWYSPITKSSFIIPRHNSQELKTGLENAIRKQAGIEKY